MIKLKNKGFTRLTRKVNNSLLEVYNSIVDFYFFAILPLQIC